MKAKQRANMLDDNEVDLRNDKDDFPCQICFNGDYEEDNLIVICSLCNIAMHQQCVYLEKIPESNWICEVCESFGPAGSNLPCPLCSVSGGAMKKFHV
jgi:bromodomain and PHD finger-containing protein 1